MGLYQTKYSSIILQLRLSGRINHECWLSSALSSQHHLHFSTRFKISELFGHLRPFFSKSPNRMNLGGRELHKNVRGKITEKEELSSRSTSKCSMVLLKQLIYTLKPEKRRIQLAVVALLVSSTSSLLMPKLLGMLVDEYSSSIHREAYASIFQFVGTHSYLAFISILCGAIASGTRLFLVIKKKLKLMLCVLFCSWRLR